MLMLIRLDSKTGLIDCFDAEDGWKTGSDVIWASSADVSHHIYEKNQNLWIRMPQCFKSNLYRALRLVVDDKMAKTMHTGYAEITNDDIRKAIRISYNMHRQKGSAK